MAGYTLVRVARVVDLTPRLRRVTLVGDLCDYEAEGVGDEYCRVFFPVEGRDPAPIVDADGDELASEDLLDAPMRNYTIRRLDRAAGEVDLDFVRHGAGVASDWVEGAAPGDRLALGAAHGHHEPPGGVDWQHLVGDLTALPAIHRIVEELAPGARVHATVVVPDLAERLEVATRGEVTWRWIVQPEVAAVGDAIAAGVRDFDPPAGRGYVWVAGENRGVRLARTHLRHELGLAHGDFDALGYWRPEADRWAQHYRRVRLDVERRIAEAGAAIADDDELEDAVDRIYAEAGLG